ncbi:hypothetical protein ACTXJX_14890 [Glutamicibacter ardleyensis]|uniref:hypothetical protein n=1 Tax=Glutamicibacter ardleyensis TaxID=225894 RepID=UPI003FD3BB10
MKDVSWRSRQSKGKSTGGQFAQELKRESNVSLLSARPPLTEPQSMFGDYSEAETLKIAEKCAEKFARQYWAGGRKVSHKDKEDIVQESMIALVSRVQKHGLPDSVPNYLMGVIASNMSRSSSEAWHSGDRKGYRVLKILQEQREEQQGRKLTLKETDDLANEILETWPKHAHLDRTNPREEQPTEEETRSKNPRKPRPGFQHRYQTLPMSLNLPAGDEGSQEIGELIPASTSTARNVTPGSTLDEVFREVEDKSWVAEGASEKEGRKVGHLSRAKKDVYNALAESYDAPIPRLNSIKVSEANGLLKRVRDTGFDEIDDKTLFRAFGELEKSDRIRVRKVFYKHPNYAQELWESTIRYSTEQQTEDAWSASDEVGYGSF